MPLTVEQCRAARALLGWSMDELAKVAEVGVMTVNRFEGGQSVRSSSTDRLASALTEAGITFIAAGESSLDGGEGVRLSLPES